MQVVTAVKIVHVLRPVLVLVHGSNTFTEVWSGVRMIPPNRTFLSSRFGEKGQRTGPSRTSAALTQ